MVKLKASNINIYICSMLRKGLLEYQECKSGMTSAIRKPAFGACIYIRMEKLEIAHKELLASMSQCEFHGRTRGVES